MTITCILKTKYLVSGDPMTKSLVSIIIPTHNCGKYIKESIESVLNQTYRNFELIIVDDGSTDNTSDVLRSYENKIKYIYQKNQGTCKARNVGLNTAKGEYIAFLDADDRWNPFKLEFQIKIMENITRIGMLFTNYSTIDSCSKYIDHFVMEKSFPIFEEYKLNYKSIFPEKLYINLNIDEEIYGNYDKHVYFGDIFSKLFMGNFILPSTVILKRSCIDASMLFNEKYKCAVDQDFHLRFSKRYTIGFINISSTDYRINIQGKLSDNKNIPRLIKNTIDTRLEAIKYDNSFLINNKKLVNKVLSMNYLRLSYYYLTELNCNEARKYALKSLPYKYTYFKPFCLISLSMLNPKALEYLNNIKKKLINRN